MLIFKDVFTGDEMLSDSYPIKFLFDDCVMEVSTRIVSVSNAIDDSLIGGNASAEGGDDGAADEEAKVNDVISSFHLQETAMDKKGFKSWLKDYMKKVLGKVPAEEADKFKKGAQAFASDVIKNFDDYQFYTGESLDPEASIVLAKFADDADYAKDGPKLYYIKHGYEEEKC
eukprot:Rmarinus@m.4905